MTPRPNLKPTVRNSEFYLIRMKASLEEANETSLPNVREQALRAAAAWQEMYEKARQFQNRESVDLIRAEDRVGSNASDPTERNIGRTDRYP